MKPIIGLTMGDPAGVGPEIILKALSSNRLKKQARFVIFGHRPSFENIARRYGWKLNFNQSLFVETSHNLKQIPSLGVASAAAGRTAGEAIDCAVRWAMQGRIDGVVTAPINKEAFKLGGWGRLYPGHTEMLTSLTHARESALMMVYQHMRVIHVTSHIPLRRVVPELNPRRISKTIQLAALALRQMGIAHPRIGVSGVNPHAGDHDVLGSEDRLLIVPAVRRAKKLGMRVIGPLSADVLWPLVWAKHFDVGVAMYHDQGQIPMKLLAFKANAKTGGLEPQGVNVTVGLPIVRTSVAHGTAYDMAGKKRASPASLIDAIELAVVLSRRRK